MSKNGQKSAEKGQDPSVVQNWSKTEFWPLIIKILQIRELAHANLFGKPGHGAPTSNIRKKKFTEYQLATGEEGSEQGLTTLDDSALLDHRPSYKLSDNPYRPPVVNQVAPPMHTDMLMSRHLSKSEPDISQVSYKGGNI